MSLEEKKMTVSHIDNAATDPVEEKGQVDTLETEIARAIALEKTQSYRDVWRTHKKALLWSIGVSWVCLLVLGWIQAKGQVELTDPDHRDGVLQHYVN